MADLAAVNFDKKRSVHCPKLNKPRLPRRLIKIVCLEIVCVDPNKLAEKMVKLCKRAYVSVISLAFGAGKFSFTSL